MVTLWRLHYLQAGMLMRGYEQFLMDLMANKDLAHALLAKLHQAYLPESRPFSVPSAHGSTSSS